MTTNLFRAAQLAATVAVLVALTGCGGTTPAPTSPPTTTPADEETVPGAEAGTRPGARTDADCADLLRADVLEAAFGVPTPLAGPDRTAQYIGYLADEWKVLQAGGLACEWMSADSIVASEGQFNYQGVRVSLLPATADLWAPFSALEAGGTNRDVECYDWSCTLNEFFPSGWWLSASASDTTVGFEDAELETAPIFAALSAVVGTLDAPTPATPPATTVDLASTCDGIITGTQVATALGIPGPAVVESPTYPSIINAVEAVLGADSCRWKGADAFTDLVAIEWLPGGAWALQGSTEAAETMSGSPVPTIAVPGVGSPGVYREHVDFASLSIEIGGSWVIVTGGYPTIGSLSTQQALVALAAQIAANAA